MLLKADVLEAIRAGRVDTVFRRWTRPTVKAGGALTTAIGVLAIERVDVVEAPSAADAKRAGFASLGELRAWIEAQREGTLYRIRLKYAGADPRIALRDKALSAEDQAELRAKLARMDGRAPWTAQALELIGRHPGRLAQELADELGLEKQAFKTKVRKLKALGLTESLETGYRLSPRGRALMARGKMK